VISSDSTARNRLAPANKRHSCSAIWGELKLALDLFFSDTLFFCGPYELTTTSEALKGPPKENTAGKHSPPTALSGCPSGLKIHITPPTAQSISLTTTTCAHHHTTPCSHTPFHHIFLLPTRVNITIVTKNARLPRPRVDVWSSMGSETWSRSLCRIHTMMDATLASQRTSHHPTASAFSLG
jgi:hypothetical protein